MEVNNISMIKGYATGLDFWVNEEEWNIAYHDTSTGMSTHKPSFKYRKQKRCGNPSQKPSNHQNFEVLEIYELSYIVKIGWID